MAEALGASWATLAWVVVNAVGIYAAVMLYTRIAGLRSFAKMSSFDFAMTVAVGSVIATTVVSASVPLAVGAVGLLAIYVLQIGVARLRLNSLMYGAVDNAPLLLMIGDEIIEENMRTGRVTRDDLRSKLREANVLNYGQVRAVVMEATGDIAVLHSDDPDEHLDPDLLRNVRGAEQRADRLRGGVEVTSSDDS